MSAESVRGWMRSAEKDLVISADYCERDFQNSCYHAQQCIEKALKAALVLEDMDVPRTHDLRALLDLLPEEWEVKRMQYDFERMASWVTARYPGIHDSLELGDTTYAVNAARSMLASVTGTVERRLA